MQIAQSMVEHNAQPIVMQGAYSAAVPDLEETPSQPRPYRANRRANLLWLVKKAGGPTELAAVLETPKTHISAMTREGGRNIGDDLATRAEERFKLRAGWMDESHDQQTIDGEPQPATVGQIALRLAVALKEIDQRRRDGVADAIARLVRMGPDETEAQVLDTWTQGITLDGLPSNRETSRMEAVSSADALLNLYLKLGTDERARVRAGISTVEGANQKCQDETEQKITPSSALTPRQQTGNRSKPGSRQA
jgi:hypothetical protein